MKLYLLLFISILIVFSTCNGQNMPPDNHSNLRIGDTVKDLSKNIMIVYQDKKNNYWFGSWEDGLYRYDGKTIIHFTTKDGLLHNRVDEIQEDKSGNIFIRSIGGIHKFNGQTFTQLSTANNSGNEWKSEPDDLWFRGSQDSGSVYRYDGKSLYRLKFPKHYMEDEYYAVNRKRSLSWSPYDVYYIYKDSKGAMWFGTSNLGGLPI